MLVTCISASNIRHARAVSTSLKICRLVEEIVREQNPDTIVQTIPLVDYELQPCTGCGSCFKTARCAHDRTFNELYARITPTDALFVVSAHYAPIPAKLTMLLEKMEQIAFLPRFHDESAHSPLYQKPVGIIGHGGGTEEIIKGYRGVVLSTIANALSWPIEMEIVGLDEEWKQGIAVPIKQVLKNPESIFPVHIYDWEDICQRVTPLVRKVIERAHETSA